MRLEHPPPIITASSIRLFAASLRNVSLLPPLLHPSRSCFHVFRDLAVAFLPASFLRAWIRVNGCLDSSSDSSFSNLADSARIFRFRNGRGILNPLYTRALKRQINLENKPCDITFRVSRDPPIETCVDSLVDSSLLLHDKTGSI